MARATCYFNSTRFFFSYSFVFQTDLIDKQKMLSTLPEYLKNKVWDIRGEGLILNDKVNACWPFCMRAHRESRTEFREAIFSLTEQPAGCDLPASEKTSLIFSYLTTHNAIR